MSKKIQFVPFAIFLVIAIFISACSGASNDMEGMDHSKMDHGKMNMGGETNPLASKDRMLAQTKNVTRIATDDPIQVAVQTSQMIWPATSTDNRPATVLLGIKGNNEVNLPAVKLIHHPNNGPLLYAEKDQVPSMTLKELQRLKPIGSSSNQGVQVVLIGDFSENVQKTIEDIGLKVDKVAGNEPSEMAQKIDAYYAKANDGKLPAGVIVGSIEQNSYTLPAANWIAHMPEALLYTKKDQLPQATIKALQGRNKKANIYVLGPDSVISQNVEKQLQNYGKVVRISGNTAEETAIAFAKYKDTKTGFGWGVIEPGHGLTFARLSNVEALLPTAAFAHLGKHAPLITLQNTELSPAQHQYLMSIQPKFKDDPTVGPYNHAYLIGSEKSIPFQTQGMIDQMLEIIPENGKGHSGH